MKYDKSFGTLFFISSSIASAGSLPVADSGLVSVFPNQTVQLNLLNVNTSNATQTCSFVLSLIDANGDTVIASALTESIKGNQVASLVFAPLQVTELRGHIDFTPQLISSSNTKDPLAGCYNVIPSLEIRDATSSQLLVTSFYGLPSTIKGEKYEKVKICHKPNTAAEKTMEISISATKGHIGHGDSLGECAEDGETHNHGNGHGNGRN
jgi:hypothetical protein